MWSGCLQVLKKDVIAMKSAGADGVVVGVLKPDRTIDVQRTAKLIAAARPMSVTFHRAFDDVRDPARALADLIKLGADRVLTSGLAATAWEGQHTIRALVHAAQGRITILAGEPAASFWASAGWIQWLTEGAGRGCACAGAGVNFDNVSHLIEATGVTEVHVGTGAEEDAPSAYNPGTVPETHACRPPRTHRRVSREKVSAIRSLITTLAMAEAGHLQFHMDPGGGVEEGKEEEGEEEGGEEEEEEDDEGMSFDLRLLEDDDVGEEGDEEDDEDEEEEVEYELGEDDDDDELDDDLLDDDEDSSILTGQTAALLNCDDDFVAGLDEQGGHGASNLLLLDHSLHGGTEEDDDEQRQAQHYVGHHHPTVIMEYPMHPSS